MVSNERENVVYENMAIIGCYNFLKIKGKEEGGGKGLSLSSSHTRRQLFSPSIHCKIGAGVVLHRIPEKKYKIINRHYFRFYPKSCRNKWKIQLTFFIIIIFNYHCMPHF